MQVFEAATTDHAIEYRQFSRPIEGELLEDTEDVEQLVGKVLPERAAIAGRVIECLLWSPT